MASPLDAYAGMSRLYLSQHTPESRNGSDIDDPVISKWLATNLSNGARVLDAGCGLGFDMLALHYGLPAHKRGLRFVAFGSDCSADMIHDAQRLGEAFGIPADRYRLATFAELADAHSWSASMDAVTVNYAIYTQPTVDIDYDQYLGDSLRGLCRVIKPGGALAMNLRDWQALRHADASGEEHVQSNTHEGRTFFCKYTWRMGSHRLHQATLSMKEDGGMPKSTEICFAERSITEITEALLNAGLRVVATGQHGSGANSFNTVIARKVSP